MDEEKLIEYISGSKSKDDDPQGKEILDDPKLLKEYSRIKNEKALFSSVSSPIANDIDENLLKTKKKIGLIKSNKLRIMSDLLKYAAVILITFSVAYFTLDNFKSNPLDGKQYAVEVPYGETANITLPDGTKVWLNSGSKMNYPATYGIQSRSVELIGEAFFRVSKNKKIPFIVETDLLDIEVTGTEFNVTSYPDEDQIYTTLVEGGVTVKSKTGKVLHKLKPEEQAILYKAEKRTTVKKVNLKTFTSWKDGVMRFEEVPLERILKNIERWYNVDVVLENNSIREKSFSGSILKNNPLDHILRVLVESSDIQEYRIVNKDGKKSQIIMN